MKNRSFLKLSYLLKIPLVRNVIMIASGTAAAQFVTILFSPFITRLYGPEAFGVLGIFMGLVAIIAPIAALNYPIAIVLPKSDREAVGLAYISLLVSLFFAVFVTIFVILFRSNIVETFNIQDVAAYLYLLPLVILSSAIFQVVQQWSIRTGQFRTIGKVSLFHAVLLNGSKVGFGLINPVATGLILLSALSNALHAIMLHLGSLRSHVLHMREKFTYSEIIHIGKRYKDFPLFRAPQVLINSLSQSIPVLMLAFYFGPASVGFYSIARTVLQVPTGLIGKSLSDVLYPRIAEKANHGEAITGLLVKGTLALVALGIVPFGCVLFFGPWMFGLVFGEGWIEAGEYARWLSLQMFFLFVNRPSVSAIPVLHMQGSYLIYELISILCTAIALLIGYSLFEDGVVAIACYSIASSIAYVYLIFWVYVSSRERIHSRM